MTRRKKHPPPCRFGHHKTDVWSSDPRKQLLSSATQAWVEVLLRAESAGVVVEVPGGWLIQGKFSDARAGFDTIVERDRRTEIHPEALYWRGAAGFLAGSKDWDALRRSWTRLVDDYPGHRFATHASVIEDAPE